jgi:hypothetical protein
MAARILEMGMLRGKRTEFLRGLLSHKVKMGAREMVLAKAQHSLRGTARGMLVEALVAVAA